MKYNKLGYCPTCDRQSITRERRPNGYDKCLGGHTYKSSDAMSEPRTLDSLPDGASILREAYLNVLEHPHLRLGQAVFNVAYSYDTRVDKLTAGSCDPFHHDDKIVMFLKKIEEL